MKTSALHFSPDLPKRFDFDQSVLIYDAVLEKRFSSWIRRFPRRYKVRSGETLKAAEAFAAHARRLSRLSEGLSPSLMQVVAFGGGSVGDFAGFWASVFKRGVNLVQVPSTWLAALDSAHGGKTALNLGGVKNQIGSFYPASQVYLCRAVLASQGTERFKEAWSEAVKIALLDGPGLWRKVNSVRNEAQMFSLLPLLIQAKMKIVARDPFEKTGVRHLLNLGHTLGHVFEAALGFSHGYSVGLGLRFAANWSAWVENSRFCREQELRGLPATAELQRALRRLRNPARFLLHDKKLAASKKIRFVLLKSPGRPVIREKSLSEILEEIKRQASL